MTQPNRIVALAFALMGVAGIGAGLARAQTGDAPIAGADSQKAGGEGGAQVYGEICAACHMPDGKGATGGAAAIPALAANPHLADKALPLDRVVHGKGGMPAFADILTPEQIADVITYVRGHFGNDYHPAVTVDEVKKTAAATAG